MLWFLPLLALAVARAAVEVAADGDTFPVVTMTVLVGMVVRLAGWFMVYEPSVATPYGGRVLAALRAATPAPSRSLPDRGARPPPSSAALWPCTGPWCCGTPTPAWRPPSRSRTGAPPAPSRRAARCTPASPGGPVRRGPAA